MKKLMMMLLGVVSFCGYSQVYLTGYVALPTHNTNEFQFDSLSLEIVGEGSVITAVPHAEDLLITGYSVFENGNLDEDSVVFTYDEAGNLKTISNVGGDYALISEIFYSNGERAYELFYNNDTVSDSVAFHYSNGLLIKQEEFYLEYNELYTTHFHYNEDDVMTKFVTEDGLEGVFTYDEFGNMIKQELVDVSNGEELLGTVVYSWSPTVITSTHPKIENSDTKVYPNPVSDMLSVEVRSPGMVSILDAHGKVVMNSNISNREVLDISHLDRGMYLVRHENGSTQKVLFK